MKRDRSDEEIPSYLQDLTKELEINRIAKLLHFEKGTEEYQKEVQNGISIAKSKHFQDAMDKLKRERRQYVFEKLYAEEFAKAEKEVREERAKANGFANRYVGSHIRNLNGGTINH